MNHSAMDRHCCVARMMQCCAILYGSYDAPESAPMSSPDSAQHTAMMPANTTSAFWKSPWRLDTSSATMSTAANALPAMMDHHEQMER